MSPTHEDLIRHACERASADPEVIGILLQGSCARGDGYPESDLDLFVLLRAGCCRPFHAEEKLGVLVETHYADLDRTTAKIRANPMLTYGFVDGRVLRDDEGGLAILARIASEVIAAYRMPVAERDGIFHWLRSANVKMAAARSAGDTLKAAFVAATTSWKMLEGIWAINDLPMPPSGTVLSRRGDLTRVPDDWDALFERLFTGRNSDERVTTAREIIEWLLAHE